ncbi:hypothetical protein NIES970_00350 [[Synechococcus] sp. NIES-970]|uniref:hypothetical protein n=1 Tax=Picosynechococcus sp. NKBG15041c TaxID=1407650 RepID=UPI0003FD970F|nr:hypothetical protein [Picosynechococcus sp. NKBG15041c]BAW95135.1 hypothetical protein NIES970_00350 [[Synechococcus] sp. NIES-970]
MRCAIISRAGQTLARGKLVLTPLDNNQQRLDLVTDGGRYLEGGIVAPDGDMTEASFELSQKFFRMWGMSDLQLQITLR